LNAPSLTPQDREQAWRLLLDAYHRGGAADRATLSDKGFALCGAHFAAGDRDPLLLVVLGRELLARKLFDRDSRELYLLLGAADSPEAPAARRAAVRCDARLREFSPSRLDWYRESFAAGSLSAALLLTVAAVRGKLPPDPASAAAVRRCLGELPAEQWTAVGLDPATAQRWLARWYVSPEAGAPTRSSLATVAEALRAAPHDADFLRYLSRGWRPRQDAEAVAVYAALFALEPDDADNTAALAEAAAQGLVPSAEACAPLARRLQDAPGEAPRLGTALARAAAATERGDEQAVAWLEAAAALPEAPPEVAGWLAVCRARAGAADPAGVASLEAALLEEVLPPAWRAEIGTRLLALDRERGVFRADLAAVVWQCLPEEQRPDDLALTLAERYRAERRVDGAAAAVYRRAYRLSPEPDLARLLAHAYLTDEETPLREKIAHWRGCLDRGEAEPDVVAALARAYASLGSATEAAIYVADNAPEAQRPRLLEELCRYRFRRRDFAGAEAIAGHWMRLRPDDPEVLLVVLACRVRRRLGDGRPLTGIDTSAADRHGEHARLQALVALLRAAQQPHTPVDLGAALRARATDRPALAAAAAALAGQRVETAGITTRESADVWMLALAEQMGGNGQRAEAWLGTLPAALAGAGRALLDARALAESGQPREALALLAPTLHRAGAPWDPLRAVAVDLAMRRGSADDVAAFLSHMQPLQAVAAELRLVAELEAAGDPTAFERLGELETATHPEAVAAMRHALQARQVYRLLEAGEPARADELLSMLGEPVGGLEPLPHDCLHWLQALLAWRQGKPDAAWNFVGRLSPEARARPAVAWTTAGWHLEGGTPNRAEAELSHALRAHRRDPELLYAVVSLDASCGRAEKFLNLAKSLLASMPADDARRAAVELLVHFMAGHLADVDTAHLFAAADNLGTRELRPRLLGVMAVAAAQVREGRALGAAELLQRRLRELAGVKLPAELAPLLAEARNLRAYALFVAGDAEAASRELARIQPATLAVRHNEAVIAEAAEKYAEAAQLWEEMLTTLETLPVSQAGPAYREAIVFAARERAADLYARLEEWRRALDHLEACLKTRPYDIGIQRRCIPALIAVGDADVALHKSTWLLGQRPHDLEILLEHAAVLVGARGARTAIEYLDDLAQRRPDAADAVRQRKYELRERLLQNAASRHKAGDFMGLFTVAREVEQLAESDDERARAIVHQAFALSNMAGSGEKAAVLEQAFNRLEEAAALQVTDKTRGQIAALRAQIAVQLAPELMRQADELMKHRRRAYNNLKDNLGAPSGEVRSQVLALSEAFERIAAMAQRAAALGGAAVRAEADGMVAEAQRLVRDCRTVLGGLP
jgi:tetratricopeptide (TPR) repeat protein